MAEKILFTRDNAAHLGKAGEHLVCADLLLRGHQSFIVTDPASPFDILMHHEKRLLKIQVKTTIDPQKHYGTKRHKTMPCYVFKTWSCGWKGRKKYEEDDIDILAFVVLSTKEIGYYVPVKHSMTAIFRIPKLRGLYWNERRQPLVDDILKLKNEGYSSQEVAEKLSVKPHQVYARYRRGKEVVPKRDYHARIYFDELTLDKCLTEISKKKYVKS